MLIKSLPFNMSWPSKGRNEHILAEFMSTLQLYEPKVISNFGTPLVRPIHLTEKRMGGTKYISAVNNFLAAFCGVIFGT